MEQWNKLVGLVKEFYIAFGQQEFLEKGMTDERMELRKKLFDEEFNDKIKPYISDELFKIYDELFNEKTLTFDLKSDRACFKNNNIRQITTCSSFTRKLSFKGKKNVMYC